MPTKTSASAKIMSFLFFGGLVLAAFKIFPLLSSWIPWELESKMFGSRPLLSPEVICHPSSPLSVRALEKVSARLFPVFLDDTSLSISLHVIHGPEMNVFSFLGGRIYIYDGLLTVAETPEEFAALVAHEIEHVKRRQVTSVMMTKSISPIGFRALFWPGGVALNIGEANKLLRAKFSAAQERVANEAVARRLKQARVNVVGFNNIMDKLTRLKSPFYEDHPYEYTSAAYANKLAAPWVPVLEDDEWKALKSYCQ